MLVKEGVVVHRHREKNNVTNQDVTRLLRIVWAKDVLMHIPECCRIQATFIFYVYCWTEARIWAFFEGGICYKVTL